MRSKKYFFVISMLVQFLLWGCNYDFPVEQPRYDFGKADFRRLVVVSDAFGAGYMDGALYNEGQANSITAIIARQLQQVANIDFMQPGINSINGYNEKASQADQIRGRYIYRFNKADTTLPEIESTKGELPLPYTYDNTLLNNFSVPGVKIFQALDPNLINNIYFSRFALNPGESSLLSDAIRTNPSFVIFWLGVDDVLNFALEGASGDSIPPTNPLQINNIDLTPESLFEQSLMDVMQYITDHSGTDILVMNLPNFINFPYFTAIAYNFLPLTAAERGQLYSYYRDFNSALYQYNFGRPTEERRPYIDFPEDRITHRIVIEDETLADVLYPDGTPVPKIRQIEEGELILLSMPFEQIHEIGLGTSEAVPSKYILTRFEIALIQQRLNRFNIIINNIVQNHNPDAELIDLYEITSGFALNRIIVDGVPLDSDMKQNGAFSLDGIYFNQRGNAFIANEIIREINNLFEANIPTVNINSFKGNHYENNF
jgi:hypothetical protein